VKPDALRGHLDALILSVLEEGPHHGYAIAQTLLGRSRGSLDLPTGSLYPALRRLERAGYIRGTWTTVKGRKRRTYQVTAAGRRFLTEERSAWRDFARIIERVLRPSES
jgi:PadR family transcriptional regulator PadR